MVQSSVEGADKSVFRDMVSVRLLTGGSDKIGAEQRGVAKIWNKHERDDIQKNSGRADEPTNDGTVS